MICKMLIDPSFLVVAAYKNDDELKLTLNSYIDRNLFVFSRWR